MIIKLYFSEFGLGLNPENPYRNMYIKNLGREGQEIMFDNYEYVALNCKMLTKFNFPENNIKRFNDNKLFAEKIKEVLINKWDYTNYIQNHPHYKKLYTIENKLDKLLSKNRSWFSKVKSFIKSFKK